MVSRLSRGLHIVRSGVRTLRTRDFGADLATVQDGLDLRAFERLGRELVSTEEGRRLFEERAALDLGSVDVAAMRALPPGTLGHEVIAHLERNGLLRDVPIPPSPFPLSELGAYAKQRWRETHDIRHVLTGLGTSIRDEVVLQAFQLGHFANRFALVQMAVGPLLDPSALPGLVPRYLAAHRAGREARRLVGVPWEQRWDWRVEDLRVTLNVPPVAEGRTPTNPNPTHDPSVPGASPTSSPG